MLFWTLFWTTVTNVICLSVFYTFHIDLLEIIDIRRDSYTEWSGTLNYEKVPYSCDCKIDSTNLFKFQIFFICGCPHMNNFWNWNKMAITLVQQKLRHFPLSEFNVVSYYYNAISACLIVLTNRTTPPWSTLWVVMSKKGLKDKKFNGTVKFTDFLCRLP